MWREAMYILERDTEEQSDLDAMIAHRIEQERQATAQQFGVPMWMLTKPVEPHMQESPQELD
jgi:hypothetical protein